MRYCSGGRQKRQNPAIMDICFFPLGEKDNKLLCKGTHTYPPLSPNSNAR